ncbi:MAG: TIGR02391 family protein [Archaeoglobaceae archaeon]|nr:TIGR02391 family protein [Archaeoglobaceae archaeon]
MVPLNLDFYELKEEIKREILNRLERIDIYDHPLDTCWLIYAMQKEGDNNFFFQNLIHELENWATSDAGKRDRDLGPLSLYVHLKGESETDDKIAEKINLILGNNISKLVRIKFNVLNDPVQVFCVSLSKKLIEPNIRNELTKIIEKNINGKLTRKVLFTAALIELGENPERFKRAITIEGNEEIEDVISFLWFIERYRGFLEIEVLEIWALFEKIYPALYSKGESENRFIISNQTLAFLYEAILKEIREPDPNILFDLYPLHPEIKKVSAEHFKNRKYVSAVFEATKKLNKMIQEITGIKNKSEAELVQATMKQIGNPEKLVIVFNDFIHEDSGKNEQAGLAYIAEGIFRAFRNPKGHEPEDHPSLEMGPYEALDQLITIDYIWRRIERAKINKSRQKP